MQDIGPEQFLMLLLVMQADLDNRRDLARARFVGAADQRRHRGIDMRAIGRDIGGGRPGDQPALRTRMPRSRRDIIGVEQEGEARIELDDIPAHAASAGTARRTRWYARDAISSGWRPASTEPPGPRPTAAPRGVRFPRARRGRHRPRWRRTLAPGLAVSRSSRDAVASGMLNLRKGHMKCADSTMAIEPDCSHGPPSVRNPTLRRSGDLKRRDRLTNRVDFAPIHRPTMWHRGPAPRSPHALHARPDISD